MSSLFLPRFYLVLGQVAYDTSVVISAIGRNEGLRC